MTEVYDGDGVRNIHVVISADELQAWIRERVNAAGLAGHRVLGVQLLVEQPFGDGMRVHAKTPRLAVMVSQRTRAEGAA